MNVNQDSLSIQLINAKIAWMVVSLATPKPLVLSAKWVLLKQPQIHVYNAASTYSDVNYVHLRVGAPIALLDTTGVPLLAVFFANRQWRDAFRVVLIQFANRAMQVTLLMVPTNVKNVHLHPVVQFVINQLLFVHHA